MPALRPRILKILGNESRLRILLALVINGKESTIYSISKMTFLDAKTIKKYIDVLERAGLVIVERTPVYNGSIYHCSLNVKSPVVSPLTDFFKRLGLVAPDDIPGDFHITSLGREHLKTKLVIVEHPRLSAIEGG